MKRKHLFKHPAMTLLASLLLPLSVKSAPAKISASAITNAPPVSERSVFVMPHNPAQGRDPFFPNSTRPYEEAIPNQKVEDVSALMIKGFVGTGADRMVVINNHTFAPGDEGDVITSQGRMHIHCLEVKDDSTVIEVNGQRHELNYHNNP